ncbi:hypothetical protein GGR57DRAFT_441912 [Xylariaceae sp. FL1272]|nr:hypothetical protein GGR57DRAFT_441912 [Xylariaceae sp. FL1272]
MITLSIVRHVQATTMPTLPSDKNVDVREARGPKAGHNTHKRKLRKGTRSCWECKRRKARCSWSREQHDHACCDACHRRGTRCIGQEHPAEPTLSTRQEHSKQDEERLCRVEALVEKVARRIGLATGCEPLDSSSEFATRRSSVLPTTTSRPDQESSELSPETPLGNKQDNCISITETTPRQWTFPLPRTIYCFGQQGHVASKSNTLTRQLVAAWPCPDDLNDILKIPVGIAGILHPAFTGPCSGFLGDGPPVPQHLLTLPAPGASPLAFAQKLLILGSYLQVVQSYPLERDFMSQRSKLYEIMSNALETVTRKVTHNDELPCSIEIVECLILESHYHCYLGNTRRSWLTVRRAMAMAQLLGLDHQQPSPYRALFTTPNSNSDGSVSRSRAESTWFLLVNIDRYQSMILGCASGSLADTHATAGVLQKCTAAERMGRLHSVAAGRIIQRNRSQLCDLAETREIDRILQNAAACKSVQWWSPPPIGAEQTTDYNESYREFIRLAIKFTHYNLVFQLWLPSLLGFLSTGRFSHSITIAMGAARELLTLYNAIRTLYPEITICPGLDFFACSAGVALCLAHIFASSNRFTTHQDDVVDAAAQLAHQRPIVRGLMEKAIGAKQSSIVAEVRDSVNLDIIADFQRLLVIEEDTARGTGFAINFVPARENNRDQICMESVPEQSHDALRINLPFCETIVVKRVNLPKAGLNEASASLDFLQRPAQSPIRYLSGANPALHDLQFIPSRDMDPRTSDGIDIKFLEHFFNLQSNVS